jgi:REP element-mobilizing transposase RayT
VETYLAPKAMHARLEPTYYYHFYNRGNNKGNIFFSEENYIYFIKLMEKYLIPVADIYCYCLLPNHYHLVFKIKDKKDLPEKIKTGKTAIHQPFSNLFNAYTKAVNKRHCRTGSLFQKHPKKIKIGDDNYLKNLIKYVNTNPSHHGIANFSSYRFSSYKILISDVPTFLKRNDVLELFDNKENFEYCHHQAY